MHGATGATSDPEDRPSLCLSTSSLGDGHTVCFLWLYTKQAE